MQSLLRGRRSRIGMPLSWQIPPVTNATPRCQSARSHQIPVQGAASLATPHTTATASHRGTMPSTLDQITCSRVSCAPEDSGAPGMLAGKLEV